MENSTSERNIELNEHFTDESHKKDSSVIFIYGDLSDAASSCAETGVDSEGGEQANVSVSCAFSESAGSFKQTTLFESPSKEYGNCEKELCDNKDPPSSSCVSCSPLSDQGKELSSFDITPNEKCDKDLIVNQTKKNVLNKDQSDRVCGLSRINPPIMIKKVTPLKSSDHGIPKSKLPSVSVTCTEVQRSIQTDAHLKRYPPISVRKMICDNMTSKKEESNSDPSFNLMNSQHSAQCMKQGQIKCDFVCSLYKSNDWIKDSPCSPKFVGKLKQKTRKKNAHVVVKNITNSDKGSKTQNEVNTCRNEAKHLLCVFCEKFFGWKAISCVKLDAPLPSSFMNPLSLLQHFGITLSIPVYGPDKKKLTFINVCHVCYDLMVDADELYKKFHSLADQMRQSWPKHTIDNNSSILMPVSGSVDESFYGCPSPLGEPPLNNVSGITEKERKLGKKPQYILPKLNKAADVSMSVIIPSELEAMINMNEEKCDKPVVNAENVKAKRVRTEPLTCGLCGKDFYVEDQWEYHLEKDHRVQKKWHRFTTKMHTRLRAHIISELIKHKNGQKGFEWCSDDKNKHCMQEEGKIVYTCDACGNVFGDQNYFVAHLRSFHSIMVDDSLVFGTECSSRGKCDNQSSDEKRFTVQSEVISGIEKGLAECYPDGNLHLIANKLKKAEDNGGVENEILHMNHLENNAGDSLLVSTYCQNIGGTSLSSSSPTEKPALNKVTVQKRNLLLDTSIDEVKCLICNKIFSSKKALEDHVEMSHLSSSVILKGNESGGVVDYAIDVQGSDGTVKKLGDDSNFTIEETVNRTEELINWQSDNVLDSSNFTDNKLKVCKSQLDKEMLQHLVYECEICSRRIAGKKLLLMHMKRMHNISMDLQGAERLRYCKYCLFRCTSRPLLKDHQKEKHGQHREANRQQCETCGKIYSSKYIQEHMSVMHGSERKHSCNLCGMKFFDHKGWRNHFYLEHANKEWKCGKCNLVFKKYHQLRQHMTYIHSTKEFKCDKCPKIYKRKGDLTVHIKRAHEKIVSFCNYCSKQYRSPYKLKAHLVNVHGLSKEETYSQRYARHKRANNKHWLLGKDSDMSSDKTLEIPEGSEVEEACMRIEKGSSELQLAEVIESTSNDLDEVTVLILSS
ncbi:uncharacterized protein LOC135226523 [Macrobrachium nipponense]|uniref:uncharacterized protein LOC135226523 n=1 Tax=Macrobrachium nipponense TaxID=159736 RepID=UPI0030C87363